MVGTFKVICMNVGKADAIILRTQNSTVIIDTGEDDEGHEIVSYLQQQNIDTIDYLIITHFDQDHVCIAKRNCSGTEQLQIYNISTTRDDLCRER